MSGTFFDQMVKAIAYQQQELTERATIFEVNKSDEVIITNKRYYQANQPFFSDTIFVNANDVSLYDITRNDFYVYIADSKESSPKRDRAIRHIRNLCGFKGVIKLHPLFKAETISDPDKSLYCLHLKFNPKEAVFEILEVLSCQPNNGKIVSPLIFSFILEKHHLKVVVAKNFWKLDRVLIEEWNATINSERHGWNLNYGIPLDVAEASVRVLAHALEGVKPHTRNEISTRYSQQFAFFPNRDAMKEFVADKVKPLTNKTGTTQMSESDKKTETVKKAEMLNVRSGYEKLGWVLENALDQAQNGKGNARHQIGDAPFHKQPICELGRLYGTGYNFGQAAKKAHETGQLSTKEAKLNELYGAINYLAAAAILIAEEE